MSMCINSVQFTSKETWKVLCGTHFKSRDYKLFFAENQCRTIYNTRSVYGLHFFIKCRYVRDVCEKIEPRRTCVREKQISQNNVYQESRRDFEIYIKVDKTDKSKIFLQHTCTCNTIHHMSWCVHEHIGPYTHLRGGARVRKKGPGESEYTYTHRHNNTLTKKKGINSKEN